ncbi:hypothetical protein ES703_88034 [subsurface metagenome]
MHLAPEDVHFSEFSLNEHLIGLSLALLRQDNLVGCLYFFLQLLVLFDIQGAKIFRSLKHHVLKQMSNSAFTGLLKRGSRADCNPAGNLRRGRTLHDQKQHAIF